MGLSDTDKQKLQQQIAFYFSNSNIMGDKFLLEKVKSNEQGWVPLELLCTKFNQVKKITQDVAEAADAMQGVEGLEVDETKQNIRRTEPLPEKWDPVPRTLYAKGFAATVERDAIEKFFSQYGKVLKVMRRAFGGQNPDGSRKLKESVYVEFEKEEEMKKALEAKPEYNDVKLEVMTKADHTAEQQKANAEKNDKKRKREDGDDAKESAPAAKKSAPELPVGTSLKFTEVGEVEWAAVKDAVKPTAVPRFCVVPSDGTAIVMFGSKEDMEKVAAQHKEKAYEFNGKAAKDCIVLEGEEEEKFRKEMTERLSSLGGGKKGGKGKGGKKGGKGGKGKKGGKGRKH